MGIFNYVYPIRGHAKWPDENCHIRFHKAYCAHASTESSHDKTKWPEKRDANADRQMFAIYSYTPNICFPLEEKCHADIHCWGLQSLWIPSVFQKDALVGCWLRLFLQRHINVGMIASLGLRCFHLRAGYRSLVVLSAKLVVIQISLKLNNEV